ncbi:MAG: hypothetical protein ACLPVY_16930 [Acidimicrobiia bacterium]
MTDTLIDEGVTSDEFASVGRDGRFGSFLRSAFDRATPWLADDDDSVDESGERGARWERTTGWIVVTICTFMVIAIIDPHTQLWPIWDVHFGWIFKDTTTNGGDMGAHVWMPWFLEHHWFSKFRLSGWAPDWYAGFPVGQYYFPFPTVMVALFNTVMPYDIAFKIVTVSGPIMLPAAAYAFARGMRMPWPAPHFFAIAALGTLVQERTDWNIYGGNIASTLAGEYSFEIALALALFALGALAYTLDTGKRPWLPAVLIAAAVMSHIVVAIFVGVAAVLLWLVRSPRRTWPIAVAVGVVGLALTAVWSLPLIGQQAYTQSMRYAKVFSTGSSFKVPYWIFLPNPVKNAIAGIVRGVAINRDVNGKVIPPTLWLPWWMWILAGVAIVAAGWYRRRSTLVMLLIALAFGVFFVEWPEHAVWNTRFLPFWLLMWALIAAMGAAELVRFVAQAVTWAFSWISDGDLQDVRAKAWAEIALDERAEIDPEVRRRAVAALAERRFDEGPPDWEPPRYLDPERLRRRARVISMSALAVLVGAGCIFGMRLAWSARNGNPDIRIAGWAQYNYGGYQSMPAWPEFRSLIETMDKLPPGRALWEGGDAIGNYGTTLALELLPYFTNGRIDSMEGLYFESSATTDYHFLTVSELAQSPSNPVRGLDYGTSSDPTDFALGVRHLQMLGVTYLMLFSPQSEAMAAAQPDLTLVATVPDLDGQPPKGWKIYHVDEPDNSSPLVTGLSVEPVVASVHAGNYQQCWGQPWTDTTTQIPELDAWECAAAPWWMDASELDKVWVASGPASWKHIDIKQLGQTTETPIVPTQVTQITEDVSSISFHVSQIGKPVLVRTSYFPNWKVSGASGVYRAAPNFMVVVPTSHNVTLTYGLTPVDWLGRIGTVFGLAGLVGLFAWKGFAPYTAMGDGADPNPDDEGDEGGESGEGGGDGSPDSAPAPTSGSEAVQAGGGAASDGLSVAGGNPPSGERAAPLP